MRRLETTQRLRRSIYALSWWISWKVSCALALLDPLLSKWFPSKKINTIYSDWEVRVMAVSASSYRMQKQLCETTMDMHEWLSWLEESATNFIKTLDNVEKYAVTIRGYRDVSKEFGVNERQLAVLMEAKKELEFLRKQSTTLLKSITPIAKRLNPDNFAELERQSAARVSLKEATKVQKIAAKEKKK